MAIQPKNDTAINVDTITEKTSNAGVTVESVLCEDGYIELDTTSEPAAPSAGDLRVYEKNTLLHTRNASTRMAITEASPVWLGTTGGSANTQTASSTMVIPALYTGLTVIFEAGFTNTSTVTLNPDTLGADTLKDAEGNPLPSGAIQAGGIYTAVFDGTDWIVQNPSAPYQDWTPTIAFPSGTWTLTSLSFARYRQRGTHVDFEIQARGVTSGSDGNSITFTLPVNAANTSLGTPHSAYYSLGSGVLPGFARIAAATTCTAQKDDQSNWGLGSNRYFGVSGSYEIA